MELLNNFKNLFISVWEKGILGVNIFEILIGIGIFFIFLIFRGIISKVIIKRLEGIAKKRSSLEQVDYLEELINHYPIDSIEDGCAENDWYGWEELTKRIGERCQLVGDDNLVTNVKFLEKAINKKCGYFGSI